MSHKKKSDTPHYELLFILPNKYTEDELAPVNAQVEQLIVAQGAAITYRETWGKRKLAYPIKKNAYGYYQLVEFDLEAQKLNELNRNLALSADVVRHQIVSKRMRTAEEIRQEKQAVEDRIKQDQVQAQAAQEPAAVVEKPKDDGKLELKDLDQKLDKILETDDLL